MIDVGASAADPPANPPPPGAIDLLLQPGEFFARGAPTLSWLAKLGIIVVMGLAAGIDRVSMRLTTAVGDSWSAFWVAVAAVAVLGGPVRWFVGGALFRLRLRLSGAREIDGRRAQWLFVCSDLILSGTSLIWTLIATVTYSNPREEPLLFVIFLAMGWSLFVSYQGARALFSLRPWPARIWLVILPALFWAAVIGHALYPMLFQR